MNTLIHPTLSHKAKAIRLFIFDVDGILTSGVIYYGSQGTEMKGFHVHDGLGIKLLQKSGVTVAVISAKHSELVTKRLQDLKIEHMYLGHEDKVPAYEALKQKLQLDDHEIAFMGDDLPDLPLLRRVGFAVTVSEASSIMQEHAHFITTRKAGKGAVREACEFVLHAQDRYHYVIQSYLTE
jgi:3-deoxy-D-manno-octulosonate 8-phosphate phosphatase (KDO 8-P phosphatase)